MMLIKFTPAERHHRTRIDSRTRAAISMQHHSYQLIPADLKEYIQWNKINKLITVLVIVQTAVKTLHHKKEVNSAITDYDCANI